MKQLVFISVTVVVLTGLFIIAGMQQGTAGPTSGEQLFKENCAACHAGGGNIVNPKMPLKGAPLLKTFATFLSQIRKPQPPMTAFPPTKISEKQARKLYDYILKQNKTGWK
jgi:cytochrome c6